MTSNLATKAGATEMAARQAQRRASNPADFAWVSANAGAGKTHVLVDRLARLLIEGTEPGRILCLTFTKAAAAEMANRLFDRLAVWAVADDETLGRELAKLGDRKPNKNQLARARQLFALALESPGGLKIHTIHAFCERVLHRFPLEAGVAPNFTVIDTHRQNELLAQTRTRVLDDAAATPGSPPARATQALSTLTHDMNLDKLLGDLVHRREDIARLCDQHGRFDAALTELARALEIDPDVTEDDIINTHLADPEFDAAMAKNVAEILSGGSKTDTDLVAPFTALAATVETPARLAAHRAVFLTKDKSKVRARIMTKGRRDANPELAQWIDDERGRAQTLLEKLGRLRTLAATGAILTVAEAMIDRYQAAKKAHGLLDFDDLVATTRNLLCNAQDTAWVLYKLDGGIDHILVDEAQDTSPEQWDIVRYLAEDLLAGESARPVKRTVFAVGDEKQSIFSFQGAAPAMFAQMRDYFGAKAQGAQRGWQSVELEVSFRSTPEILAAVDAVFAKPGAATGLTAGGAPPRHIAHRTAPGRVEVWPVVEPDDAPAHGFWEPVSGYSRLLSPKRRLAREIAEEISGWLTNKVILEAQGRPIRPGDILVLVRRRNDFVDMLVRELKSRAIPVAGVDRMQLAKQIVVQDLLALARFALLPQDDLSLAALLKSPLIGLDEEALFDLAHDRKGSLWATLRSRAANDETLREAERRLSKWLSMADFKPPHDFFADILATNDNRARIFARLGVEAADPIEEFLNAAMNFAHTQIPTLEGFLGWLGRDDIDIKRDLEHGQNQVRVMTVHGAKGLEANIVFLPDTCAIPSTSQGSGLCDLTLPGAFAGRDAVVMPVWPGAAASTLPALARARDEQKTLDMQEHNRLAYVAMTRARDWLIVCGYQGKNRRPDDCWYDLISTGLDDDLETFTAPNGDQRRRIRATRAMPRAPQPSIEAAPDDTGQSTDLPAWARTPAPAEPREAVLRPSIAVTGTGAGGRLSPLAELRERRFTRGRLLHALLERLPALAAVQRAGAADTYLAAAAADLSPSQRASLRDEALAVIEAPAFAPFLGAGSRAEVPFSVRVENPFGGPDMTISGQVDRLAHTDGMVHVLDFKTHRPGARTADEVAPDIIRQMALYRAAFAALFEQQTIVMSVLWTDGARLMTLTDQALDAAFDAAARQVGSDTPADEPT